MTTAQTGSGARATAPSSPDLAPQRPGARPRARLPHLFPITAPQPVTPRSRAGYAGRAAAAAGHAMRGTHITGQLKSLAAARDSVHDAAAQWDHAPAIKAVRLVYGYLWLALKAALNTAELVTEHPPVLTVLAVVGLLAWLFT